MPLSDMQCRTAKPKERDYRLKDEKGLSLLIKPTGGKWWRMDYTFGGKRKTLSMGTYPDTSLKMARDKRDEARQMIAKGIDPSANRKAAKTVHTGDIPNSFKLITIEWLAKKKGEWVEDYYSKVEARMKNDILPWLGDQAITDIEAIDIIAVLRRIEARGALETAHRARVSISQIFRYAVYTGRAKINPAREISEALAKPKEQHMAAITEPALVGGLLRQMADYSGTFIVRCALQLAPLVFVRPGELRQAQWKDINLNTAEWRFKASKTGHNHLVPLSRQAVEVLKSVHPLTGHSHYVFPSSRTDHRPMSNNAVLSAFRRMGIEKEEMSGHGFRAMARTLLAERLRYDDAIIEHQLAHQVRDVHGRAYNRTTFLDDRKIMMQHWADYLDNLKAGQDIVPSKPTLSASH